MSDILNQIAAFKAVFTAPPRRTPTNAEPDGPLCGNGSTALVLGGTPDRLRLWIGKTDCWRLVSAITGGGLMPAFYVDIAAPQLAGGEFYAEQRMESGEIRTRCSAGDIVLETVSCVVPGENIAVTRITCRSGKRVAVRIEPQPYTGAGAECRTQSEGGLIRMFKAYRRGPSNPGIEQETMLSAACRILGREDVDFRLGAGDNLTVVTVTASSFERGDYEDYTRRRALELDEARLTAMDDERRMWWARFWESSGVTLPGYANIERFWYASHYILACCCASDAFAPGLFGAWPTTNYPDWSGDYHLNYNYQAPWWGVYSSNKVFLADPYDQPLIDALPRAKRFAQYYLGVKGAYFKVGIGPKGADTCEHAGADGKDGEVELDFWGQKSNGLFATVNMFMRFYSTYDLAYARKIYPFLLAVTDFWEDYLEWEDGRYVDYNDYIHENGWAATPEGRIMGHDKHHPGNDFNPILTLALLRCFYRGLTDVSEALGFDAERRGAWRHILEHLSPLPTQERGGHTVLRYTERGTDWHDDNTLGIQPVYPAGAIGLLSSAQELRVARNTFEELNRWEDYNGFPTYYTAGARIGVNPDLLLEKLGAELGKHALSNLFVYYGGGGIECCSAVPGCVNEMLLQSHQGVLLLFPVWNKKNDAAFYRLRAYGAFVVSAALRNGVVGEVCILSEKGRDLQILSPWPQGARLTETDGTPAAVRGQRQTELGAASVFATKPGTQYLLLPVEM